MSGHTEGNLTHMALPAADGTFMVLGGKGQEYGLVAACTYLEDARRLSACWNACDGIDTETLENVQRNSAPAGFVAAKCDEADLLMAERNELRRQKAQMLDLLGRIVKADDESAAELARIGLPVPPEVMALTNEARAMVEAGNG